MKELGWLCCFALSVRQVQIGERKQFPPTRQLGESTVLSLHSDLRGSVFFLRLGAPVFNVPTTVGADADHHVWQHQCTEHHDR